MSWLQKRCVVVPVDFSEGSFQAVGVAKEFLEKEGDLHVIHVTQPWNEHEIGGSWGQQTEEDRLRSIEKAIQEKLQAMDHEDVRIAIHMGSPPAEIVRYAEQVGAELIVMPSVGKTGLKHFALGSVAERVVRRAHCPVLVLRKKDQKKGKSKKIIDYD